MKVEIIGKEKVCYVSKKTNKEVNGVILYYKYPIPIEKGEGFKVDKEYINIDKADNVCLGDIVEFLYNRYGTVEELRLLS